jgi:hypothetical protein
MQFSGDYGLQSGFTLPKWMKEEVPLCAGDEKINERKGEKVFVICQNSSLEIPN